ncbi:FMRFamide receptor-like [Physella acuta]|uniref:FMRFamide receptor-like n=1 Tax=Physella acuta TaxID=109671 RepID=UPI0027DDE669|nr:FMRFamide receptor-like [Physella acuta]
MNHSYCEVGSHPDPQTGETGLMGVTTYQNIVLVSLVISSFLSPLGIVFNIINIIVYVKLGFNESTNIILASLAVADTCILLTLLGYTVNSNPLVVLSAPSFDILAAVGYLVLGWPNVLATRIAGCLTTFLTFERFVCVAWPLKVKALVTKATAVRFTLGLFVFSVAYSVPMYLANSIGLRFNPMSNQTSVGLIVAENSDVLEGVSRSINISIEFLSFSLVILFTGGLIQAFFRSTQWRNQTASVTKNSNFSNRDRMLLRMVLLISFVFIGCSLPLVVADVVMLLVKDYNVKGKEQNLFIATIYICFNLSSINSTVNMFIYLKMSSKFRNVFYQLFHRAKKGLPKGRTVKIVVS